MTTLAIVLKLVFVMTAMLFIGISTMPREVRAVLADRNVIFRAAVANLVLVPALGVLLVLVLPLSPDTAAGILLLALAPGGINAFQFSSKVTGQITAAAAVTFALTIVSFIIAPIVAVIIGMQTSRPPLPYLTLLGAMLVLVIGPITLGQTLRLRAPGFARKAAHPLNLISTLAFIGAVIASMPHKQPALGQLGWAGIAAVAILILGAMAIGWIAGKPDRSLSQVLVSTTSNRNAAICLLIATVGFAARSIDVTVLAFLVIIVPANLVFTVRSGVKAKR